MKYFLLVIISILFLKKDVQSQATCLAPQLLTSSTTCTVASPQGNLKNATSTGAAALPTGVCGGTNAADVWFSFVAKSIFPTITLSSIGTTLAGTGGGPRTEIFSGTCGNTLVQNVCGTTLSTRPATALTIGSTYYIRITPINNTTQASTNTGGSVWTFDICITDPPPVVGSAMNEVFKQTALVAASNPLNDPWEITYGSDGFLWITVAKDYKVLRINPATGAITTVLDISPGASGYLTTTEHTNYNRPSWTQDATVGWPQGGMMGLALHPDFMNPITPKKYVFVAYVRQQDSLRANNPSGGYTLPPGSAIGQYYRNFLVRFTYNTITGKLESPVTLCDTLPGSSDHNSGRLITAPIGGTNYLFYSSGDMGAGQYSNLTRIENAQNIKCYEGKILRFNLDPDADATQNIGVRSTNYNQWIPSSIGDPNPYNSYLGVQSAVWSMGHRNVQGFASANIGNVDYLYASSHGPMSDDELNIMQAGKNYGHPLVIGYAADGNYNLAKAGQSPGSLPFLTSTGESDNVAAINALPYGTGYKDPIYSFYPSPQGSTTVCSPITINGVASVCNVQDVYNSCAGTGDNNYWRSEAPSGLGIYTDPVIPGWKNSLLLASLKWGRLQRVKLNTIGIPGTSIAKVDGLVDTMPYFKSQNRYRDMAIATGGKDIFIIMDKSASTSGPSTANPSTINCGGCVVKYSFLGYNDNAGVSTISTSIPLAPGISNSLTNGTPTIVNTDNNFLWVPITDSLGNIVAEIYPNGNILGNITATLYKNNGPIRTAPSGKPYLDRSLTITVQNQPATSVNVRLYITATELASLTAAPSSGVSGITSVNIFKNNDANAAALTTATTNITPTARTSFGSDYVLTASVSSLSSFYFAGASVVLPINELSLSGKYQNQATYLSWITTLEINSSNFSIERSNDGQTFKTIGSVLAVGNSATTQNYSFIDNTVIYELVPVCYYRLKLIDKDGTYKYSNTISVALPGISGTINIFPNPAFNELHATVKSPNNCKANWQIIDNTGRVILQSSTLLKKGDNNISININHLSTGLYYLHIFGDAIECKTKFLKQ